MEDKITILNDGSDMLKVAHAYSSMGWCVLPVKPGTKPPAVVWKEYQTRRPTDDELMSWFGGKSNKEVGITLVTGAISGVSIIDIDEKGNDYGISSGTYCVSGGGGKHFYFKYDPKVKSFSKYNGKPIDSKNDGGVIVLAPTIHPNGNQYKWESFSELQDFPHDYWFANIDNEVKTENHSMSANSDFAEDLVKFYHMKEGEGRNEKMVAILGKLKRYVANEDIYKSLALYIGKSAINPLSSRELEAMMKQANSWSGAKEYVPPEIVDGSLVRNKLAQLKELEKGAPSTGYSKLDREISGFLPGNVYILSGETNSGKTQMAANFAHNIAKQGKGVLYIALEPQERILNYVCSIDMDIPYTSVTADKVERMSPEMDNIKYVMNCSSIEELKTILEGVSGYSLIVIDHIGYFVSGQKGDVLQKQQDLMKELPRLARAKKCAVLAIAHVRKGQANKTKKRGRTLDGFDITGSGAFIQDATDVLLIKRRYEDEDADSESNKFRAEGGLIIHKTKNPQPGAKSYVHMYFVPDSAKIKQDDKVIMSDPLSMGIGMANPDVDMSKVFDEFSKL